jgi:histidinol-phosphate aminotransferase
MMNLPTRRRIRHFERDTYLEKTDPGKKSGVGDGSHAPAAEDRGVEPIDCAMGYSPWGASPLAVAALRHIDFDVLSRYPEKTHNTLLKPAILDRFHAVGVTKKELFLGHGSFNLIERVIHKLLKVNKMVGIGPQFTEIPSEFKAGGGSYLPVPLKRSTYALPVDELEAAVERDPVSILYIDNPNNPTGRFFDRADIERLASTCERLGTVLLVDEAWGDFVDDHESSVHLVGSHINVIVVRSFSKALGLAGERIGYMFMSKPLANYYREIDVPFEPGIIAATLGRETLSDAGFLDYVRGEVRWAKGEITRALHNVGLTVLPNHDGVSIMAVHLPSTDVVQEFRSRGILVQAGSSFAQTHEQWDDSYCRLRVVQRSLVSQLCDRISTMK